MRNWNYKNNKDYLAKLEQNYGNFFVKLPLAEEKYDLAIKLAFFNVRARLDVYRDWDSVFGSGERAFPDFLKLDGFLAYLFIPSINIFWHYKWLVRNSKTFYYNYQRFPEFLLYFEFCNFIESWLIEHGNEEKFPLLDKDVDTLRNDLSLVSRAATAKGRILMDQFPVIREFENNEFQFSSDEDLEQWSFESYAFRYRDYVQNLSFDFKGRRILPTNYYIDLMLSFRISLKLLYESEQVFGAQQDLFFVLQYYFTSSENPLLTVLRIRYFYYYFFEKNRETIFKDLLVYWFGNPIKKNSKYGHVLYLVRHKEKQFLYYISLTINFTDKNFSQSNLILNFGDQIIQNELEDKLIFQHYTLTVDTSHFDDTLKIPQLAKLDLKLDYFSPNLLNNDFEKKFLFKFYAEDKFLCESAEFLDTPTDNATTFIFGKFSGRKKVELLLPNLFDNNDPSFKETIHKPTYHEIERFSDRYSRTKDGVAFLKNNELQ